MSKRKNGNKTGRTTLNFSPVNSVSIYSSGSESYRENNLRSPKVRLNVFSSKGHIHKAPQGKTNVKGKL